MKLLDRIGLVHNYSFESVPVQARQVKRGDNVIPIFSNTKEHAAELNWPGSGATGGVCRAGAEGGRARSTVLRGTMGS